MLKIKDNVDLKELEKFGFKILVDEDKILKELEQGITDNYYCNLAYKDLGNHFSILIENDNVNRQITIVPDTSLGMRLCLDWQLDALFDLIQADLVEKVEDK